MASHGLALKLSYRLQLRRQRLEALGVALERPAYRRVLYALNALAFLVRHGSAGGCRSRQFGVGEIEWHAPILAPARPMRPTSSAGRGALYKS